MVLYVRFASPLGEWLVIYTCLSAHSYNAHPHLCSPVVFTLGSAVHSININYLSLPVLAGKNEHHLILFAGKSKHHLDLVDTFHPNNFFAFTGYR